MPFRISFPLCSGVVASNIILHAYSIGDEQRCTDWARYSYAGLKPHAMGSTYVNFIPEGDEISAENVYGPNYDRLKIIKMQFDPDNPFRSNQNISPLPTEA